MPETSSTTAELAGLPNLQSIYERLYERLPWPQPIPCPAEVTIRWKARVRGYLGRCTPKRKLIEINPIYQDPRLHPELEDLVAHEVAHFIWPNHSRNFTQFLRRVGVAGKYVHSRTTIQRKATDL